MILHQTKAFSSNLKADTNKFMKWHRELGHVSTDRMITLAKQFDKIPRFERYIINSFNCVPCMVAKSKKSRVKTSTRKTTTPLELAHLDISGEVDESPAGFKYTVAFLDDYTAKSDVMFIKARNELSML